MLNNMITTSRRSKEEIKKLVQQRVQQRDSWLPKYSWPPPRKLLPFLWKSQMLKVPSQKELDDVFPVKTLDWEKLQQPNPSSSTDEIDVLFQCTWLGHASVLIQMNGKNILTDPIFSQRCAPCQWAGPKRFRSPPCSIQELCDKLSPSSVDVVLISHNHYDHLDWNTLLDIVKYSDSKPPQFVVPLGLREWIHSNISKDLVVHELDWHESASIAENLVVTAVPMRHWSNRTGDRDETLWCGYSVHTATSCSTTKKDKKFLFPGDTAWFEEMAQEVGEKYGPFDAAAIPIGAYEPRDVMKINHINVEEAIKMKDAVRAKMAIPIHWGTFPLTLEPVMEPRDKLIELMAKRDDKDDFVPWLIGETKRIKEIVDLL
jgi:N-acyl-phosphatidylethanolamine-hydrolysing phospholipase D